MKTSFCLAAMGLAVGVTLAQTEAKTQTYKGTLMDASCAAAGTVSSSSTSSTTSTASTDTRKSTTSSTESTTAERHTTTEQSSAATGPGQPCAVTTSTTEFALKLDDGRIVRFDSVGNMRAQEAIKNKKKWTEAASAGKPIHAKVSGMMSGEKLVAMSIH